MVAGVPTDYWAILLPVIVGGAIGVAGGLAGPPIAHWLAERSSRETRRAERFEEMMQLLYDHDHWLEQRRNVNVFGQLDDHLPSPLPRAEVIASLYFPDLVDRLDAHENLARLYVIWQLAAARRRLDGDLDHLIDGQDEVYKPYRSNFVALQREFARYATQHRLVKR